jgi:hypothetical protein
MVTFVVIFNLLLTLVNLYIVFRLWKLWRLLVRITETLTRVERRLHAIFYPAPAFVLQGQTEASHLRQTYQKLEYQLQQLQQVITFINVVAILWQRQLTHKRHPRSTHRFRF